MTPRAVVIWITFALPGRAVAQNVSEVQVAPPTVTVKVGERSGLLATAFDRAGNVIPTVRFIWSSNNVSVAKVDNDGTVTGVAGGVAIVEARVGPRRGQGTVQVTSSTGLTATAPVVVQPSDIAIQEPSPVTLGPNDVDTLHVIVPGQGNRVVSPLTMQWASADPNVARVSLTGVVTAVAPGKTTLSVSGLLQTKSV